MVLIFVLGIPALLFYQLRKHAFKPKEITRRTRVVLGFLFFGFEHDYYFWEMVTMARKAGLACVAVFMSRRAQLISVGLILTLALIAHMGAQPYKDSRIDTIETVAMTVQ